MTEDLHRYARTFSPVGPFHKMMFFESVASTNTAARELLQSDPNAAGTVVVADFQTGGRGRSGRTWDSVAGQNLLVSIIFRAGYPPEKFFLLNLASSLAIVDALKSSMDCEVKWPNDVMTKGKKLAGILVESLQKGNHWFLIAGIGINVNQVQFAGEISGTATSVRLETGQRQSRSDLIDRLLKALDVRLNNDERTLIAEWKKNCSMWGKEIRILRGKESVTATAVDLSADGGLVVDRSDGQQTIYAADVSLRL